MRRVFNGSVSRRVCVAVGGASLSAYHAGGAPPAGPPGGMMGQMPPGMAQQMQQQQGGMPPQGQMMEEEQGQPDFEAPKKPEGTPKFIKVETDEKGITTLKMSRAPVNSLSFEVLSEMNQWLMWLGSDESIKAVILTSDLPMVFSAGVDINELHQPTTERFEQFWGSFQENWMILQSFPKPVIAAISGNSPAGGCVMALGCDFRIMARSPKAHPEKAYRIGLNETKLGIVAPPWVMASFAYVVGQRKAERMLQLGETPTAEEALTIGLVDAVVDEDQVMAAAQKEAERFVAIPAQARWMSRDMMRREVTQFLGGEEERKYDTEFFNQMLTNPDVQTSIGNYLARLGGGKKK